MYVRIALLTTALLTGTAAAQTTGSATDAEIETQADADSEAGPETVTIARVWSRTQVERASLSLLTDGARARTSSLVEISILARPHGTERPTAEAIADHRRENPDSPFLVPGILRLHPGLLHRLARIAARWPGRRIDIVSGFRPRARRTSRHRHGRALDLRVVGVSKRAVSEFARTLDGTGVGFYPNSLFTHIDVREQRQYWVDRSGPGEAADYGAWPPTRNEQQDARRTILADTREALRALEDAPPARSASSTPAREHAASATTPTVPVAPATPTMPVAPASPIAPTAPTTPAAPAAPSAPPAAPAEPAPPRETSGVFITTPPPPDGESDPPGTDRDQAASDAQAPSDDDGPPRSADDDAPPAEEPIEERPLTPEEIAALRDRIIGTIRAQGR